MSKDKKKEVKEVEAFPKTLYIVREDTEEEGLYDYLVYEKVESIEAEGVVLVYELKQKTNLKITNVLEPIE